MKFETESQPDFYFDDKFNDTKAEYPKEKLIHQLFEEQVESNPEKIALIFENESITYSEFNTKANRLAHTLRNKGITSGSIVAVICERSPEMLVAIYAILKAGGAYLPIDPELPLERIKFMLTDARVKTILTQSKINNKLSEFPDLLNLDDEENYSANTVNPDYLNSSTELAYVIYTSGSTGTPKGVMIQHRAVINFIDAMSAKIDFNPEKTILAITTLSFDIFALETLLPLSKGLKIVIASKTEQIDANRLDKLITNQKIDILQMTPSRMKMLLDRNSLKNLSEIIVGGEALSYNLLEKLRENSNAKIFNVYGPTETTIWSTLRDTSDISKIDIGKPIANTQIYIFAEDNSLCSIGVAGELCIGGDGLAKGYLNRPELTAEKFVTNSYTGERMYRTGDLARWLPDGNIEYLGRIDHQVKIRGYRIETGEIEATLLKHPDIKEAVVIAREKDDDNYLVAYFTSSKNVGNEELISHLANTLPEYMIPTFFMQIDNIPLNVNGKIDRKALPEVNISLDSEYTAPENETEKLLVKIWQDVLKIDRIGTNDNFFRLGGNSLNATMLLWQVEQEINRVVSIADLFKAPTIKGLANLIVNKSETIYQAIELVEKAEYYSVSAAQKRMYLLQQFNKNSINYNLPVIVTINGDIDKNKLEKSFNSLIARHEVFRTSFRIIDREVVQVIHDSVPFSFSNDSENFVRPFDLSREPLIRACLTNISDSRYILLIDMHHIISDGLTVSLVIDELFTLYEEKSLPPLKIQYKDFAAWQNKLLLQENMKEHEEYWLNLFNEELQVMNLPLDYSRPVSRSYTGTSYDFSLDSSLTKKLRQLAANTDSTLFMNLLAIFNILLAKYSGQEEIVIGSVTSGRSHPDTARVAGMFVNTLALRNKPKSSKNFKQFLEEVKENSLNAFAHQDYQFETLVDTLKLNRDAARNPLFDVMFVLQNPSEVDLQNSSLNLAYKDLDINTAKFDITLEAIESGEQLVFILNYSNSLFKPETISRMAEHFQRIAEQVINNPEIKLGEIDLLSETEKNQLLYTFNNTKAAYPENKTIMQLFAQQVKKTPEKTALVFEDKYLTYAQLDEKTNKLAHTLINKGITAGSTVGIIADKSLEMIIAILAIIKAGGAYLPIDPNIPEERISFMLQDTATDLLLTQNHLIDKLDIAGIEIIDLDDPESYFYSSVGCEIKVTPSDLAYIIYTSGSTGLPKGVMVEHKSLVNLCYWHNKEILKNEAVITAVYSNYVFDAFVWELFPYLVNGSELHILNNEIRLNISKLNEYFNKNKVSTVFLPTAVIEQFNPTEETSLKTVLTGGDKLKVYQENSSYTLINNYGPTEATVVSTYFRVDDGLKRIPIGKPINNARIYILNRENQLCPVGVAGELCIGGEGLARGYLNRPELTAEKFTTNPYTEERMYRTGDLARWLADGNIEYLGRIDHQVKIRGFRIETGEIEATLLKHPDIKEAVVIAREKGNDNYLVAYYTGLKEIDTEDLREYLADTLPEYMIPAFFAHLQKIPLTTSGKVDRKALPHIEVTSANEYVAPENEIEEQLVKIWKDVLNIDKIGTTDNFFHLGGHSLKATIMLWQVQQNLNKEITLTEFFKTPTVKALALLLSITSKTEYEPIEPLEKADYYPVSSVQKRMYLLQHFAKNSIEYNIPITVQVTGQLEPVRLEEAIQKLINRHESLRTSFEIINDEVVQVIHDNVRFSFSTDKENFIRPFNLSQAPLFRAKLTEPEFGKYTLLLDMHHIISDGASVAILLDELAYIYEGKSVSKLPELKTQYKDFAGWQNKLFASEKMSEHQQYWLNRFKDELPVINLPTDFSRPALRSVSGKNFYFSLETTLTEKLKQLAMGTGTTMFILLSGVFNILLASYTGQEDIIIGSVTSGRNHPDIANVSGMFVNTIALRNKPATAKSFKQFLNQIKEDTLDAFAHQNYQFETLVEKLNLVRDTSRSPLFDVMFVLQNQPKKEHEHTELQFTWNDSDIDIAKFDLTLEATEINNSLSFIFNYADQLFKPETIARMADHFIRIAEQLINNPDIKLGDIDILSVEEKELLLYGFNDNKIAYPENKTIQEIFEEQVNKSPKNIALFFEDQQFTYQELNEKVNRLAWTLRNKGVGSESVIALMTEPSAEMIIAILAILKAGGAYLPIAPDTPAERVQFMLKDSNAALILLQKHLKTKVETDLDKVILGDENSYSNNSSNPEIINSARNLVYIIYTSGSTGLPKGTMIEHRSVNNLIYVLTEQIFKNYPEPLRISLISTFVFDASVEQIFGSLLNGYTLYVIPEAIKINAPAMIDYHKINRINIIDGTPAYINLLMESVNEIDLPDLYCIISGGEQLSHQVLSSIFNTIKGDKYQVINTYGPTEACVDATSFITDRNNYDNSAVIPIGEPIGNTTVYIFDKNNRVCPLGVAGELCIGGDGLARGYLNRPELTAEKFTTNPYTGERMYRTGDLARWLPDGNIEYLGRIDHQVKIRGFRIETGEIEATLLKYSDIKETIVIAREKNNDKYLVAYFTSEKKPQTKELKKYLSNTLPEYMIPSFFIQLQSIPLNINGKIDRKALPEIEIAEINDYVAPQTEVEEKLVKIWKEVLNIDRIGTTDNFFHLGGHSLKAMVIIWKVNQQMDVEIPMTEFFKRPTVKALAEYLSTVSKTVYENIEGVEKADYYPVSAAQKRMYLLQQFDKNSINYNIPHALLLEGNIDVSRLEKAFHQLINRHESLRTSFEIIDAEVVQLIKEKIDFKLPVILVSEAYLNNYLDNFVQPFDLGKGPLIRIELLKLSENKYLLLLDMHHIITDGVSGTIILEELSSFYQGDEPKPLTIQYKDFAGWQNKLLTSDKMDEHEQFWLKHFNDELPVLNLPVDFARPLVSSHEGDIFNFPINSDLTEKLGLLSQNTGTTLFMSLLSVFNILMAKYSGQEDIIAGTVTTGRSHPDTNNIVGMFVNTLALRNKPEAGKSFKQFLAEIKENSLNAFSHQDYQFETLVEKLKLNRDTSRNPLFDVMFVLQNNEQANTDLGGLKLSEFPLANHSSKFDLTLTATEINNCINFEMEYSTALFKKTTIEKMAVHFTRIIEQILNNPAIKLAEIDILTEAEKEQLLYQFNDTKADYPKHKLIHQVFEEQVALTPDNIAVIFEDKEITYSELNIKANRLAVLLRERGVKADSVVSIISERSIEMMVGIITILKAGGGYLPIAVNNPSERTEFMLDDANVKIILTQEHLLNQLNYLKQSDREIINLDDPLLFVSGEVNNPEYISDSTSLAYIIYTSGSTGMPKGVMIEHYSVINRINWMQKAYPLSEKDVILQKTPYTFDVSVWELFWWFFTGAKQVLLKPGGEKEPKELTAAINKYRVTTMHFVPSMLSLYLQYLENNLEPLPSLKYVFASGEALAPEQGKKFYSLINNANLINLYGPTEATVDVSYYDCKADDRITPIGKPIDNIQLYIFDKNDKLCPVGVAGELCIGGDGLARGYLNRPELTAEKFTTNPYTGAKMYRTGDLSRWLPDGNIEYLGRIDHQVKIRGFRIEIGEIETTLLKHLDIKDVVVMAREKENDKYLAAYFTSDKELSAEELREYLAVSLPEYMIPSFFIRMENIPLNSSGKADRKVLPEPLIVSGSEYQPPVNQTERHLVNIWQDVLKVDKVGITDNFFHLGGHSLKATIMLWQVQQQLNADFPLAVLFKYPTVKALSEYITGVTKTGFEKIEPVEKVDYYPVSAAQKRMYLLQQFDKNSISYNMPVEITISGELDRARLVNAFQLLINRHESFRTAFTIINGEVVQIIKEIVTFSFSETKNFVRPFDLSEESLIRASLTENENNGYTLLLDMHHIISDGITISLVMDDLLAIYHGKELPPLKIQYKDFASWQNKLLASDKMQQHEQYWLKQFNEEIPVLSLPLDYTRPTVFSDVGADLDFTLNPEVTGQLKRLGINTGTTLFMNLLAIFNILLAKYSGQEDIVIGSVTSGRSHPDTINVAGMFVNTLALRNKPESRKSYKQFLEEVKENSLDAFAHQDYQFENLVEKLNLVRDTSRSPLFDVMFVLQNNEQLPSETESLNLTYRDMEVNKAKFDIGLQVIEINNSLKLTFNYSTALFKPETISRMAKHFHQIVEQVVNNPELKLLEIEMLSPEEKEQLLYGFNDTKTYFPDNKTIVQLFEEQVSLTPDNIALVFEDKELNYSELNSLANRLARSLRKKVTDPESVVAIIAERSLETIVAVLAILKAGGAYLPIDPDTPAERIRFMISDSNAKLILTQTGVPNSIDISDVEIINLDDPEIYSRSDSNPVIINGPSDLAYIIYTSGSTGLPKGVMVSHKAVVRLVKNTNYIQITENDRIFLTGTLAFDASTFEIWGSLLNGAGLYGTDKSRMLNLKQMAKTINNYKISVIWLTSGFFNKIAETETSLFKGLKYLIVGGERLSTNHINRVKEEFPQLRIINGYGPTENTTFTTTFNIEKFYQNEIPIGRPIANTQVYIFDKNNWLCPVGIGGELCIGGDGLAKGYLNRPELTAEKFTINPYTGERMYRTGDLVRWLADGNIEYLGRIDHQVKIRGFRIETGEIEATLLKHPDIKEAVVIVREKDNDKYLVAYYTASDKIENEQLRFHLATTLPEYMFPAFFIQLEYLPLSINGKVDKKALPDIDIAINENEYVAPQTETEEILVKIWKDVLKTDNIGTTDNFFHLGGHSLKATIMLWQVQQYLNADIPLTVLFKHPTVRALSEYIIGAAKTGFEKIESVEKADYYPVSAAQKRMYLLQQFDKNSIDYNIPVALTIEGSINKEKIEKAFIRLINRHESLRTSFAIIEDEVVQFINPEVDFRLNFKQSEPDFKEFVQPFDLSKSPLIMAELVEISENNSLLILDMHHIISDGVSLTIIIDELFAFYEEKDLPALKIQYKDFALWQNKLFASDKMHEHEQFWLNQFNDEIPVINLPADYARPAVLSHTGANLDITLNSNLTTSLKQLGLNTGTTLFMNLLAIFNILLSKYSGQEDIIIGSVTSGRSHPDTENVVGMFVNTLALRNKPETGKTFTNFLEELKENSLNAFAHQDYQFEALVDKLKLVRDTSRNPLFDVMFVLQNQQQSKMETDSLKLGYFDMEIESTKFDLNLIATETNNNISLGFNYSTALFKMETINRLATHFITIVEQVVNNPEMKLGEIEILSATEQNQLLYDFNNTKAEYPETKTIIQLFSEQVNQTPDSIAVVFADKQLTYSQLNVKAEQLATNLQSKGITTGSVVAIIAERSIEVVAAIMAVLKTGAAYLPVDPTLPAERISFMVKDSGARLILSQTNLINKIAVPEIEIIDLNSEATYPENTELFKSSTSPDDLAYIIYTSGSTGLPKGAMITNRSLVNYIYWAKKVYLKGDKLDFPLYSSISFDLTVTSVFTPLISGSRIVIYKEQDLLIKKIIDDNQVQIIKLTPSHLKLIEALDVKDSAIKAMILGGENLTVELANTIYQKFNNNLNIYNEYGPTETTVGCMIHRFNPETDKKLLNVPVGVPAENVSLYIFDRNNKLCPVGVSGELCIGGDGLAKGYLNRPELTDEKFVINPYTGTKMYRSGDLARWLPDGTIEYLGRIDHQVKVRGFRIETGEIEATLLKHCDVKEAVVIARDREGDKYLTTYFTSDKDLSSEELKVYLAKTLPEYMIPAYFMRLKTIPVNNNGKVERKALPEPEIVTIIEYIAPQNETEKQLVQIWQDILGVEKIGITDNFFHLGGHSLKATIMSSRIYYLFHIEVPLVEIFRKQTIRELASYINSLTVSQYKDIPAVEKRDYYPQSPAQKRVFRLAKQQGIKTALNVPAIFIINGIPDLERFALAAEALLQRHEALRTSFRIINGQEVQIIHETVDFKLEFSESNENIEAVEKIAADFVRPFDLEHAPLIRMKLVKLLKQETEKYLFLLDVHNIIVDGVSLTIILNDFLALYEGKTLTELKVGYKDFTIWQEEIFKTDTKQKNYWQDNLAGIHELNLPTDYPRPAVYTFAGDSVSSEINTTLTETIMKYINNQGVTLYMFLLAVFSITLAKYSGQDDIIVGSPVAGRKHVTLENILGMFVNMLAMRNNPKEKLSFTEFLSQVRDNTLNAYSHQDYQYEKLIEDLKITRKADRNTLYDARLVLQNMDMPEIKADGITFTAYDYDNKTARNDISLFVSEENGSLTLLFEYYTAIFDRETIMTFAANFKNITDQVIGNPDLKIGDLIEVKDLRKK